jgi:hypothetical protein
MVPQPEYVTAAVLIVVFQKRIVMPAIAGKHRNRALSLRPVFSSAYTMVEQVAAITAEFIQSSVVYTVICSDLSRTCLT